MTLHPAILVRGAIVLLVFWAAIGFQSNPRSIALAAGNKAVTNALPPEATAPFADIGIDQHLDEQLPLDLPFYDETGEEQLLQKYFDRTPVVLCLVYFECPMLCNQVMNGVIESLRAIDLTPGQDYQLVVVSFDPRETPRQAAGKKRAYVSRYARPGATDGFHFLTGNEKSIGALAKAVGFRYRFDERSKQYAHASGITVATPEGKLARYFYGIDYPTRDLRLGLIEASAGKIGSPVDQILLLCFHYDPKTGRYGMAISTALRAGGTMTLIVLGAFIFVSLRRDRTPRATEKALGPQLGRS